MRISDWSSDVCSSDLCWVSPSSTRCAANCCSSASYPANATSHPISTWTSSTTGRSEEHTSELQSLMRISYAVFCLTKKKREQQTDEGSLRTRKRTGRKCTNQTEIRK